MSDQGPYPPPGQNPPPPGTPESATPPPAWFPPTGPPPPGYAPPPGYGYHPPPMAAAHKPGAIPLRPLQLGDIFDAAFKIIRYNPAATVGSAVLVTTVAMAIPIAVTGLLATATDLSLSLAESESNAASDYTLGSSSLLQVIGLIFVTGMIAHVASAAAIGRRLSLGGAWAATAGKRWKLVGLTLLLFALVIAYLAGLIGVIVLLAMTLPEVTAVLLSIGVGLVGLGGLAFFWTRVYYLAVPPLMLENVGVIGALKRAWALTAGQFWRTFGIGMLTGLITQIIGSILAVPFAIAGVVAVLGTGESETSLLVLLITQAVATVVSSAFVAPFTASVTAVQYLDQRIRKEGYDVELLTRAGITGR